jgi:creatinine amidohydrolase
MNFAELTAPEIRALSRNSTLIIAPIAAMEQHGPHLPVSTDTILAGAVAAGVEKALADQTLVLPVLWLGASDHHLPRGGTLTSPLPTYEQVLVDLLTPLLRDGFRRVMILNGHGGNIDPLHVALRRLDVDFPKAILTGAAYWDLAAEELAALCRGGRKEMGHACEMETSMVLHLRPDLVKMDRARDDPDDTANGLRRLFWARDFDRRTDHGVVGYPELADADRGRLMLEAAVGKVAEVARTVLELKLPGN